MILIASFLRAETFSIIYFKAKKIVRDFQVGVPSDQFFFGRI
jgi:hypothetical protein